MTTWAKTNNVLTAEDFEARIVTEQADGTLKIKGIFENNSLKNVSLTYKFKCKRVGKSGTSATSQSGTFKAAPGETIELSSTAISFATADRLELTLKVFDGQQALAEDALTYPN